MSTQIEINGYHFSINEQGKGKKLFLIHGSASDKRTWSKNIEKLAQHFHVISYSRRYHWPNMKIENDQDYSMSQHVEDLEKLLEYYTDKPVNLIGHSYGALVALEFACKNLKKINKMILLEPPAIRLFVSNIPKPKELLRLLIKRPKTALSIIKLGAFGLGPATKAAENGNMKEAMRLFGEAVLGREKFNSMSDEKKEQALINLTSSEFTGTGFLPIIEEKLRDIQFPVLILTGEKSNKVFLNLAKRLVELIPNATQKEIPESSHIIHEDNAESFNSEVLSFLLSK